MNYNKILDLLNNNKIEEAKLAIYEESLKSDSKTKYNLFSAVRKYINRNCEHKNLNFICWKNGKQFIVNGITAFIFKNYVKEFEQLPNLKDESQCLNIFNVFDGNVKCDQDDILLLKNLKQYTTYFKLLHSSQDRVVVYFNNNIFDVKVLQDVINIMGLDGLKYSNSDNLKPTYFETNEIKGIALPLRVDSLEIKILTENFIKELKEV